MRLQKYSLKIKQYPKASVEGIFRRLKNKIDTNNFILSKPKSQETSRKKHIHSKLRVIKPLPVPKKIHTFDNFKSISYRYLWISTAIFSGAFWLQQVVIGWLAYEVTKSASITTFIMGLDALPILLGGPLGGAISDKFDKRHLLTFIYSYQAILMIIFSIIIITGQNNTWTIMGFVLLMGLAWTIHDPARMSLISSIVPKENLINAFALNSMAFSLMRLIIPALGGIMIATIGIWPILIIEASLMILAGIVVQLIAISDSDDKGISRQNTSLGNIFPEMRSGIHFVITHPTVIGFMFLTFLMVLLVVPFFSALIPVYSATIYNVGAKGLGLLLSAAGLGSLLGTMILASCGQLKRPGIISFNVLVIIAILMIAISLNKHYGFALLLTMLISGAMMTFFSVVGATVQSILPEHMRGKVTGIYMMCWGLIPFGAMTSGFIANGIGADLATRIGALLLTVGITISFFIFRNVWNFRMTSSDESIEKNRDTSPNIPDLLEEPSTS